MGGTKYLKELRGAAKFLTIIRLLNDIGKVVQVNSVAVDKLQVVMEEKINNPDFDDPHLPAIVIVSKCQIICSKDHRAIGFVTKPNLYPNGIKAPVFYTLAEILICFLTSM